MYIFYVLWSLMSFVIPSFLQLKFSKLQCCKDFYEQSHAHMHVIIRGN